MAVLCDSFNIPILFLVDSPGYTGGMAAEQQKLVTKSMRWLQALSMITVPKLTVVVRKAYGLALSHMCGTDFDPDFIAALTTADIRPVSSEASESVNYRNTGESDARFGRERILKEIPSWDGHFRAAVSGLVDDMIEPRDTRKYLIDCLEIVRGRRRNFIGQKLMQTWPTGF